MLTCTEETKDYYDQAMTYWLAVEKHGEHSDIAKDMAVVLNGYEADAKARGVPGYELSLLKATARVKLVYRDRR